MLPLVSRHKIKGPFSPAGRICGTECRGVDRRATGSKKEWLVTEKEDTRKGEEDSTHSVRTKKKTHLLGETFVRWHLQPGGPEVAEERLLKTPGMVKCPANGS